MDVVAWEDLVVTDHDALLWGMVESAWERLGVEAVADRDALVRRAPDGDEDPDFEDVERWLGPLIDLLREDCGSLSDGQVAELDRRLAELDRADIHDVVEGSEDGFLYRRGFVVALGPEFHAAVLADARMAVYDAECAEMITVFL